MRLGAETPVGVSGDVERGRARRGMRAWKGWNTMTKKTPKPNPNPNPNPDLNHGFHHDPDPNPKRGLLDFKVNGKEKETAGSGFLLRFGSLFEIALELPILLLVCVGPGLLAKGSRCFVFERFRQLRDMGCLQS